MAVLKSKGLFDPAQFLLGLVDSNHRRSVPPSSPPPSLPNYHIQHNYISVENEKRFWDFVEKEKYSLKLSEKEKENLSKRSIKLKESGRRVPLVRLGGYLPKERLYKVLGFFEEEMRANTEFKTVLLVEILYSALRQSENIDLATYLLDDLCVDPKSVSTEEFADNLSGAYKFISIDFLMKRKLMKATENMFIGAGCAGRFDVMAEVAKADLGWIPVVLPYALAHSDSSKYQIEKSISTLECLIMEKKRSFNVVGLWGSACRAGVPEILDYLWTTLKEKDIPSFVNRFLLNFENMKTFAWALKKAQEAGNETNIFALVSQQDFENAAESFAWRVDGFLELFLENGYLITPAIKRTILKSSRTPRKTVLCVHEHSKFSPEAILAATKERYFSMETLYYLSNRLEIDEKERKNLNTKVREAYLKAANRFGF